MTSMSKRAQARTEKELHELLRVPGNSTCADCGARNPAWASWSLGIFLCMRCATIHRKLGTHVSKVKSLSMDTWTSEQVESMKKNGNTAVNKVYNPTNKKPDMPLDADEVDNAMERFIRKKYQDKTLANGKPPVPVRDDPPPMRSRSPENSPPPVLPAKKGKFFGFGLRASSSAYPFSKGDKKNRNEPRVDSAFRITSENYNSTNRIPERRELTDDELQSKLTQLRDMGFTDTQMNTKMLRFSNGDVEKTVTALVQLGHNEPPKSVPKDEAKTSTKNEPPTSAPQSATSNNPFDELDKKDQPAGFGLSFAPTQSQPQSLAVNTNPWQTAPAIQTTGLEQSFAGMQVSQPLFPHNTGGFVQQDPRYQQSMTPPVPNIPRQWSATVSPATSNNPYIQTPLSAHSTGSNPYASHMQNVPAFAPSPNPFYTMQASASQQSSPSLTNPFGLPPSQSPTLTRSQPTANHPLQSIFDPPSNAMYQQGQFPNQQMPAQYQQSPALSSPGFPNFQYGQPQPPFQQPQQIQQYQPQQYNPYQQQPLQQQQTGRYAKNDILALFNHPQMAPQKPLASIPEPAEDQSQSQQTFPSSPYNAYASQNNNLAPTQRSATMPVTSSAATNRNPFLQTTSSAGTSAASTPQIPNFSPSTNPYHAQQVQNQGYATGPPVSSGFVGGARHASADSVSVNNPYLMDGRHSPDAFASLSARSAR